MTRKYLTFQIENQTYGFPIEKVCEINRIGEVTKVPCAPLFYTGVMNLRGCIIAVVSLRLKMGIALQANTPSTCVIVVESGDRKFALVVDAVDLVVDIEEEKIEKNTLDQMKVPYIEELAKLEDKIVLLVNIDKCLLMADSHFEGLKIVA